MDVVEAECQWNDEGCGGEDVSAVRHQALSRRRKSAVMPSSEMRRRPVAGSGTTLKWMVDWPTEELPPYSPPTPWRLNTRV